MKIGMFYDDYMNFGNEYLFTSAEISRAKYYAPAYTEERIAGTLNRNDLHPGSQFSFLQVIKIDPDRSTRHANFVPSLKKWGTTVRTKRHRSDYSLYFVVIFETNVYSVEKDQELRSVNVEFKYCRKLVQ